MTRLTYPLVPSVCTAWIQPTWDCRDPWRAVPSFVLHPIYPRFVAPTVVVAPVNVCCDRGLHPVPVPVVVPLNGTGSETVPAQAVAAAAAVTIQAMAIRVSHFWNQLPALPQPPSQIIWLA